MTTPVVEQPGFDDLKSLKTEREEINEILINWIAGLSEDDLGDYLPYQNMAAKPQMKLVGSRVIHLFLHQIHHTCAGASGQKNLIEYKIGV